MTTISMFSDNLADGGVGEGRGSLADRNLQAARHNTSILQVEVLSSRTKVSVTVDGTTVSESLSSIRIKFNSHDYYV